MPYKGGMTKALNEVAFTAAFLSQAKAEGMGEDELTAIADILSLNPAAGDLIRDAGGCRKFRIARKGGGKSGGYRVVTFYAPPDSPVYVVAALAKNSRANFTANERAAMARFAKAILAARRNSKTAKPSRP